MLKVKTSHPILVVDDCDNNLCMARRYFARSRLGNAVITLHSGQQLLDYMGQVATDHLAMPALILLDIDMPGGLSGLETLRNLRASKDFAASPPVIMFTASTNPRYVEEARVLGADAFKEKPGCGKEYLNFLNSLV